MAEIISWDAIQNAIQAANNSAQMAYYNNRLALDRDEFNFMSQMEKDKLAFEKAKQAWYEGFQQSQLDWEKESFGQQIAWDKDKFGQEMAWDKDKFGQQIGFEKEKWGQQFGLEQGDLTGYYNGQATLGREQMQNQTSLGYLNLIGQLRGPQDYFQYLKVLNSTPQGLRDLVNASAGTYTMGGYGGANQGAQTQAASLAGVLGDVASGGAAQTAQMQQALGGLPRPNQINAANYNQMAPTQKALLYGAYEAQGYRPEDVEAIYKKSLPKYGGPSAGAVGY